ncbi:MAG: hypothetical protein ACTTIR_06170 [Eggerthia catenaformis]|uniref:hypothetical protein n=1 Tax=Eggerthia catenaformis TaxID=31973 RepID=UPI003F9F626E
MSLSQILRDLGINAVDVSIILIVMSGLIQISPIHLNPWSWIGKQFGKAINGEVIEDLDVVKTKLNNVIDEQAKLKDEFEERKALTCRVRILNFGDRLLTGSAVSKESYFQIFEDMDFYDRYCREHPDFINHKTTSTTSLITKSFQNLLDEEYKSEYIKFAQREKGG